MHDPAKRYMATLTLLVGACLAGLAGVNYTCDPYGVYHGFDPIESQDRKLGASSRIGAAERVKSMEYDWLMVGSSRVGAGFSPHSQFYQGLRVLRVSLAAGSFDESEMAVKAALVRPGLKRITLGLDFFQFSSQNEPGDDFQSSRFNTRLSAAEFHADKLLGWRTTKLSVRLLKGRSINADLLMPTQIGPLPGAVDAGAAQLAAFDFNAELYLTSGNMYHRYQYDRGRIDQLKQLLVEARKAGVEVQAAVLPVHAVQLETIRAAGLWDTFEMWKRDLTQATAQANAETSGPAVRLWDFTSYAGYTAEPLPAADAFHPMLYYREGSHFTPMLGELVLARLIDAPAADRSFGVPLTLENLESHLSTFRRGRSQWLATRSGDARRIAQMALECVDRIPPEISELLTPVLASPPPTGMRR